MRNSKEGSNAVRDCKYHAINDSPDIECDFGVTMTLDNIILKIKKNIKRELSPIVTKNVGQKQLDRCKLIMTLLVKNEVDIVRKNIEFHLRQGVDFIIATDNVSDDGTYGILKEFEQKGVLYLIQEEDQDYDQAKWVNYMGRIALEQFGANIIFHCDADEFWYSKSGDLKRELLTNPLVDILTIKVKNVLLEDKKMSEGFPVNAKYIVENPIIPKDINEESKKTSFFLFECTGNVMYRLDGKYLNVSQGNHRVIERKYYFSKRSSDITVYHFPIRGKAGFFFKVMQGGAALEQNTTLDPNKGWHWRRWYDIYKKGELEHEYQELNLSGNRVDEWIARGVVVENKDLISKLGLDKE